MNKMPWPWQENKNPSETDQGQDAAIQNLNKRLDSIVNWCNSANKHFQALYNEIAALKGYDQKHDTLFKNMQETDQKMQAVLDALSNVAKETQEG